MSRVEATKINERRFTLQVQRRRHPIWCLFIYWHYELLQLRVKQPRALGNFINLNYQKTYEFIHES